MSYRRLGVSRVCTARGAVEAEGPRRVLGKAGGAAQWQERCLEWTRSSLTRPEDPRGRKGPRADTPASGRAAWSFAGAWVFTSVFTD